MSPCDAIEERLMNRCSVCILPETYPGIRFNSQGVCNQCVTYKTRPLLPENEFYEILDRHRGKHEKYDCIVALSGGRDSSYVLWLAKRKLGLRVLACFVDNGYAPDQTRANIRNAVDALGVDLLVKKHDHVKNCFRHSLKSWIKKPAPGMIGLLCGGCVYGLKRALAEAAAENHIPLMLYGVGEPEPATSFAEKLLMKNSEDKLNQFALAAGFASNLFANPSYLMNRRAAATYFKEFAFRWSPRLRGLMLRNVAYPEFRLLEPFYYLGWDEREISSVIERELGWRKIAYVGSTWRSDCEIATLKNYLYTSTLGFSKVDEFMSTMIRAGMITREAALERFEGERVISEDFVNGFLARHGLDLGELKAAIARTGVVH
jgi:tRNA(Ile)-lysidine synthase TilS/MesJ